MNDIPAPQRDIRPQGRAGCPRPREKIQSHGKSVFWPGQTAGSELCPDGHRQRHVTVRCHGPYERKEGTSGEPPRNADNNHGPRSGLKTRSQSGAHPRRPSPPAHHPPASKPGRGRARLALPAFYIRSKDSENKSAPQFPHGSRRQQDGWSLPGLVKVRQLPLAISFFGTLSFWSHVMSHSSAGTLISLEKDGSWTLTMT